MFDKIKERDLVFIKFKDDYLLNYGIGFVQLIEKGELVLNFFDPSGCTYRSVYEGDIDFIKVISVDSILR